MPENTLSSVLAAPTLEAQIEGIHTNSPLAAIARIRGIQKLQENFTPDQLREALEGALAREVRTNPQRRAVIQALKSALKKLPVPTCDVEVISPAWDRCRQLIGGIKLHFRLAICYQAITGMELAALKKELGFVGGGRRKELPHGAGIKGWDKWCEDELDLSADSADRWIAMAEVVKPRLKKLGGNAKLLSLVETSPGQLDAIQRQTLEALVAKVTDGDTQKDLLEEFKLVKLHDTSGIGGDTSGAGKKGKPNLGQLAFKFFEPFARSVSGIAIHPQRDAMLAHLAADSPEKLHEMEISLETALEAVRAAKAKRVNPKA